MSSHVPTDFVYDLPMEVPPAFYPPPTVWVPQIEIPPLRNYEYKFEHEKTAILRWENEKRRVGRNGEKAKEVQKNITQRHRHIGEEEGAKDCETEERHISMDGKGEEALRRTERGEDTSNGLKHRSRELLKVQLHAVPSTDLSKPDHLPHFSSSSFPKSIIMSTSSASTSHIGTTASDQNGIVLQKSCSANNNTLDGLEEFEPRRDLFDLMELRSLDARKELEKFFDL